MALATHSLLKLLEQHFVRRIFLIKIFSTFTQSTLDYVLDSLLLKFYLLLTSKRTVNINYILLFRFARKSRRMVVDKGRERDWLSLALRDVLKDGCDLGPQAPDLPPPIDQVSSEERTDRSRHPPQVPST